MSIYDNTTFTPNEIGIFEGLPMDEYRGAPGIAGSDLEILKHSPAAFHRGEREDPTQAMEFGTLFHSLLFSGNAAFHTVPETYRAPKSAKKDALIIDKEWNWNATYCKQWRKDHQDKPIIPRDGSHSSAWLKAMSAKVEANPLAADIISRLTPEVSVFSRHAEYHVLCKGRLDGFIRGNNGQPSIIVELKTTLDCSTRAFSREVLNRGYYRKAAWYRMLLHGMRVSPVEFWFIAAEKRMKGNRPRVNVRQLAERAMDKGDFDNDDALKLYMQCKLSNFWPDLPDEQLPGSTPEIPFIDLPDYAYGASVDELQGMTEVLTEGETA